jgi:hypothetical protein
MLLYKSQNKKTSQHLRVIIILSLLIKGKTLSIFIYLFVLRQGSTM